jgi:hypothetical protein
LAFDTATTYGAVCGVSTGARERAKRAGDRADHAERAGRATHERGLPRAELARDRDDVARRQAFCETSGEGLRLVRRRSDDLHERTG